MFRIWHSVAAKIVLTAIALSFPAGSAWSDAKSSNRNKPEVEEKVSTRGSFGAAAQSPVPVVYLDALVMDEDGRVLGGLTKENFRIFDNNLEQEILSFAPVSEPITVVLLLEHTSSSYSYYAAKAMDWADRFLNQLDPKDWIALATFDLNTKVQVDFTHNRVSIRDALRSLRTPLFSDANLFEAIIETLDKLDRVPGKKAIVLMATGRNSFSAAVLDEVLDRLRDSESTLFCIGIAEEEAVRYGASISYHQGKNWLTTFAQQTGGLAMFPRFEGELPDIFRSVVSFLRNEYAITFSPRREMWDGRYHRLKIDVIGVGGKPLIIRNDEGKQRKVEVHARKGYFAPVEKQSQTGRLD